jgi:hypothetical protein
MSNTKSQSAMEFTLLIAALFFIFIPLFFILTDFSFNSNSEIQSLQVQSVGQKIVDESREIFYQGRFSREIITLNLPEYVTDMSTLIINKTDTDEGFEYYLIINYTKSGQIMDLAIPSEIPIVNSDCQHESNCYGGLDCTYCYFNITEKRPGVKNFMLETISFKGGNAINITHAIW